MVLWDGIPHDQGDVDSGKLVERIISEVSDRDIILLHSGVEVTLQALPSLIAQLKKRGFELVTISELKKEKRKLSGLMPILALIMERKELDSD